MFLRWFSVAIALLCFQQMFAQSPSKSVLHPDSIQQFLEQTISTYQIPGIAVALVSGDSILYAGTAGQQKIGAARLELRHKMHLGSCGKAMTAYVAGRLVERNLLSWKTKLIDVFPELRGRIHRSYRKITLQQLLSHQSLVAPFVTDQEWNTLKRFSANQPIDRRYAFLCWVLKQQPQPFDKEDKKAGFRYSNAGYALAAAMLERVTQQSWESLMKQELFDPLKLDAIIGWPASSDTLQPWGHQYDSISQRLIAHDPNDEYQIDPILSPAGNISMSVVDYAKFIQKNLRGLSGQDDEFLTPFYEFLHYANYPKSEYAMGWYTVEQFDDQLSMHTGSADTFYALNLLFRKHNLAVIVLANSATEDTKTGAEKIRNYLIRPYLRP